MSKIDWPKTAQEGPKAKVITLRVFMRGFNPSTYHIRCESASEVLREMQAAIRRKDAFMGTDAGNGSSFVLNGADIAVAEIISEEDEVDYYAHRR